MTKYDQFIRAQAEAVLQPGEQILNIAFVTKAPSLWVQMLLIGGLLLFLLTKAFYIVVTDRRILLFSTKMGFSKPKMVSLGLEEIDLGTIANVTTSGFANNRSITFHFADNTKRTLRIAPWSKVCSGQKTFLDDVSTRLSRRQIPAQAMG